MKHLVTLLSVALFVGMMVDVASAAILVPGTKNNVTICVRNSSGAAVIAVIIDPSSEDLGDYFDGNEETDLFRRDGGQFINRGTIGEFKSKAGNHRIVAVNVGDIRDIAVEPFNIPKNVKKVNIGVDGPPLLINFGVPR